MNALRSLIFLAFVTLSSLAFAKNIALLVGVSNYPTQPLEGPVYDVAALNRVLINKWGFSAHDVITLIDEQASRGAILREMDRLYENSQPGDNIFIYFSGHGTSVLDNDIRAPLPTTSGAFIPYDVHEVRTLAQLMQKLLVGRSDLRPRIRRLDESGRHVFMAIDACYSGNTVRSTQSDSGEGLPSRYMSLDQLISIASNDADALRDESKKPSIKPSDKRNYKNGYKNSYKNDYKNSYNLDSSDSTVYPYTNTLYIAAAGEHEKAADIPTRLLAEFNTIDNKPHGAFTNSLLELLHQPAGADFDGDGQIRYAELKRAIVKQLRERGFNHTPTSLPTIEQDIKDIAQQTVFLFNKANLPVSSRSHQPSRSQAAESNESRALLKLRVKSVSDDLKRSLSKLPFLRLVNGKEHLILEKKGARSLSLSTHTGNLIADFSDAAINALKIQLQYEQWLLELLTLTERSRPGPGIDVWLAGPGWGSTLLEGDYLGFNVSLPKGGSVAILNFETSGWVNVIYPANSRELMSHASGSKLLLPNLTQVTPPYGRDLVLFAALKPDSKFLESLLTNPRFRYDSVIGKEFVSWLKGSNDISTYMIELQTQMRTSE